MIDKKEQKIVHCLEVSPSSHTRPVRAITGKQLVADRALEGHLRGSVGLWCWGSDCDRCHGKGRGESRGETHLDWLIIGMGNVIMGQVCHKGLIKG